MNNELITPNFDLNKVRKDFYYLNEYPNYSYLDNAATTQRPIQVVEAIKEAYLYQNANPLRGTHLLANKATEIYENSRKIVADFIGADKYEEIIFTRNATESLNLVANCLSKFLNEGDEILISRLEHHSNSVPWQKIALQTGAKLVYADQKDFSLDMNDLAKKANKKTKIISITAASNVTGDMPDLKKIVEIANEYGAYSIIDASQYVSHKKINVSDLGVDFIAFSGHKLYGPFGIGVLYGKYDILNSLDPFLMGGEMIEYVYDDYSTYAICPYKFEAGTQNVVGAYGLAVAIQYMEKLGLENIYDYEVSLTNYCENKMKDMKHINILRPKKDNLSPVISFTVDDVHPHDVATILDAYNVACRSGHHCAQQLHRSLGINSSSRVSFSFYNTKDEVDRFIYALGMVRKTMGLE